MRIWNILAYLCIPIPLCTNKRFVFSQPNQGGGGRGNTQKTSTPQPQATPNSQSNQPGANQIPSGQQKKQGASGGTGSKAPQPSGASAPQPSKTQKTQASETPSPSPAAQTIAAPTPEVSQTPSSRRLGVDYFTPPGTEYGEDHSTTSTLAFAFNLQIFTKTHIQEHENDVTQYERKIGHNGFIYKFKDGAKCIGVKHSNLPVWKIPEGSDFPETIEFIVGTPCHILIKTPKQTFNYRKVTDEWQLCSYTTYSFSYMYPTLVDIVTSEDIYGTGEKENNEVKYTLNTEDKYKLFYFEFPDSSYCRKLSYGKSVVWTHDIKIYGSHYPKRIYFHKDDVRIVLQFKKFFITYTYSAEGKWRYHSQIDYTFNEIFLEIITDDPDSYQSTKKNDKSQYSVLEHYFTRNYMFKEGAKCLKVKYSNKEVWERGMLFEDNYPKSIEYNYNSRNFIINFDADWYYHYSFDPNDEKWYLDKKEETAKPKSIPSLEYNRPVPKAPSETTQPKEQEISQLQEGVKVTIHIPKEEAEQDREELEQLELEKQLEQEPDQQEEEQEQEKEQDQLELELELEKELEAEDEDQQTLPPEEQGQPEQRDEAQDKEKAMSLRNIKTPVLTSEDEPLRVDRDYNVQSLEQVLGYGIDEFQGSFELAYEYDKFRKVIGVYFNKRKIWKKSDSDPCPKSITFLSDIFMNSINFTHKHFYIYKYSGKQWEKIHSSVEETVELDIAKQKGSVHYLYGKLNDMETYLVNDKYLFNRVILSDSNYRGVKNSPLWEANSPVEYSNKVEVKRKLGANLKSIEVTIYLLTGCEVTMKSPGWNDPFTTISWSETSLTIDDEVELTSADNIKGDNPKINDVSKMDVYKYRKPNGNEPKTYKYLINLYSNYKCLKVTHKQQIVWEHDGKHVKDFPRKITLELDEFTYHFEFDEKSLNFTQKMPGVHTGVLATNNHAV